MTTLVSDVIGKARVILKDTGATKRWSDADFVKFASDGQREIAAYKPEAYVKNQSVQLVSGSKQTVPTDCSVFIEITRNMGTNGTTAGSAVRLVDRKSLDQTKPTWMTVAAASAIKNYVFNALDPLHFYTYPPSDGTGYVEMIYDAIPPALTATNDALVVGDMYAVAMMNYLLYRAYSIDASHAANAELAMAYFNAFQAAVGAKAQSEANRNPNAK